MKCPSKNILTAAAILCLIMPFNSFGATANVSVINFAFIPATTNILAGDQVIWTWGSGFHSTTSSHSPALWDSGAQNTPFSFTNKFNSGGTFPYLCTVHGFTGNIIVQAVNVPPSVSITNPATGTVLAAPATVTVQASASDSDGTVTNVQFVIGSTILTNEIAAPFFAVTSNLVAGSYIISAIASDNLGAKNTNSVNIIVDVPPSITITNPASGVVLSAPANVNLGAIAFDSDGTVTNVQFLIGSTSLTNLIAAPFFIAATNLAAGNYTLSAIASDNNGIKSTNVVVINVVTPSSLAISAPQLLLTNFQFSFSADIGLSYVVQRSTSLTAPNWISLYTNTATSNPVVFVDIYGTNNPGFYRVGRMPNP